MHFLSCMKFNRFHLGLFLRVQLAIFQHWFRYWLGTNQATNHYLNQWWLDYWCIYALLGLSELTQSKLTYRLKPYKETLLFLESIIDYMFDVIWTLHMMISFGGTIKSNCIFYQFSTLRLQRYFQLLPLEIQRPDYPTESIPWLLMTWLHKEPGHQQPWYWPSSPKWFRPQDQKALTWE